MPKYIIEGGIDFFSELYKSLDDNESIFKTEDDNNLCLITNQLLTEKYVTMNCGHKFNYIPLFKDIDNHKKNFNNMESTSGRLGKNEIRCPYCRKKQTDLLPYYENIGVPKVPGINEIYVVSNSHAKSYEYHLCQYIIPVISIMGEAVLDASGIPQVTQCKFNGTPIDFYANNTNYGDTKNYCWEHKKIMIRKYKKELVEQAKAAVKEAKLKAKEEAKKAKEEAKVKEKEEKTLVKKIRVKKVITNANVNTDMNANMNDENLVLGPSTLQENNNNTGCISILKSGVNKGKSCGCLIYNHDEKLCKRHYKTTTIKETTEVLEI
jgi:hypothetical protein